MRFFFLLMLFSFLGGIISSYLPLQKKVKLGYLGDFVKGVLIALIALYLVGTPMSLVVAGCGLLAGNLWFPYPRWRGKKIYGSAAGLLLIMAPDLFLLLALWIITLYLIQHQVGEGAFISSALILPHLMLLSDKSDVYFLFSTFIMLVVFIGNLEQLFKGVKVLGAKTGWRYLEYQEGSFLSPFWRNLLRKAFFGVLIVLVVLGLFLNRYVYRGFGMQVDLFRRGTEQAKVVALTFDDGPDQLYTPKILEILKEEEVKATFFLVGTHVEQNPLLARRIVEEGHEIGSHTYSHHNLLQAPLQRVVTEITLAEEAILTATEQKPTLFRPPRGLYDAQALEELKKRGYTVVLWSLSSRDWLELRASDITHNVINRVSPGEIILFHDSGNIVRSYGGNRLSTVQALRPIIQKLREEGYDFVTITELLILSGLSGDI